MDLEWRLECDLRAGRLQILNIAISARATAIGRYGFNG